MEGTLCVYVNLCVFFMYHRHSNDRIGPTVSVIASVGMFVYPRHGGNEMDKIQCRLGCKCVLMYRLVDIAIPFRSCGRGIRDRSGIQVDMQTWPEHSLRDTNTRRHTHSDTSKTAWGCVWSGSEAGNTLPARCGVYAANCHTGTVPTGAFVRWSVRCLIPPVCLILQRQTITTESRWFVARQCVSSKKSHWEHIYQKGFDPLKNVTKH